MFFSRLTFGFLLVTVAAFFCAQSVEAAKGPRVTHKVYFDMKHGDKDMGRSQCTQFLQLPCRVLTRAFNSRSWSVWRCTSIKECVCSWCGD